MYVYDFFWKLQDSYGYFSPHTISENTGFSSLCFTFLFKTLTELQFDLGGQLIIFTQNALPNNFSLCDYLEKAKEKNQYVYAHIPRSI